MFSRENSGKSIRYPMIAKARFAIIPDAAIRPIWNSVISENE